MNYCKFCMSRIEDTDRECPFCGRDLTTETPAHHLAVGTILNGKFMVGEAIGEGGFGITYIGRDTKLDMKVAIKEYYPNGYANRSNTVSPSVTCGTEGERKEVFGKGLERFLREARILAKFSDEEGIVTVRDFFEENNTAYIVMEYLDGQTLKEFLKTKGTLPAEYTIRLLMPVMQSLEKVHKQGLIHRDISPDNIMLVNGKIKLLDFGAARNVSAIGNQSLSVMLKPGYAPEEQYRSKGVQGPWTDVYAICATMYKCITGITPDDSTQRLYSDELKTPTALGIDIDPMIENALMKGLSVLKKDRYQSIEELLDGFKGINVRPADGDDKTVYSGAAEQHTEYIHTEEEPREISKSAVPQTTPASVSNNESPEKPDEPKKETPPQKPISVEQDRSQSVEVKSNEIKKSKAPLIIAIAVGCVLAAAVVVLLVLLLNGNKGDNNSSGDSSGSSSSSASSSQDSEPQNESSSDSISDNSSENNSGNEVITMSDNLFDFTFELDGVVYQLPMSYDKLVSNGWTISSSGYSDETKINGESYISYYMVKNGKKITVYSYNPVGNAQMIKECRIGGIETDVISGNDFTIAKGINCASTADEIINAFGAPTQKNENTDRINITYSNSDYSDIRFICYNEQSDKQKYSSIRCLNFVIYDDDKTETNEEVPEYLSEYKAPTSLGEDPTSGIISIGGDLYQIPAPLSQFLDNGWKITSQPGAIAAGTKSSITIARDDSMLSISVINLSDYQTIPENCAVYSVSIDNYSKVAATIPGGLELGTSTQEDIEKNVGSTFSLYEGSTLNSYNYNEYQDRDFSLTLYSDSETKIFKSIRITCQTWNY